MPKIITFIKVLLISVINCNSLHIEQDISEGSHDNLDRGMNGVAYIHEDLDQSVEGHGQSGYYDNGCIEISTKRSSGNFTGCGYQANIRSQESEESQSTLIDFPYSASIQRKGAHYASGALINDKWVLTSAGEFFNVRESIKLFKVRLGSVDCKRGGTLRSIKNIEIHPKYEHKRPNSDIALLRLSTPVEFSDVIMPIPLSDTKGTVISAKFLTTYWARIVTKESILPETAKERVKYNSMRVSTQKFIPTRICSVRMSVYDLTLDESTLCLKPVQTHHSVCMPDAGAPVVADDVLWGISSGWVPSSCPQHPGPTLFTRVALPAVRTWIESQLKL